MVVTVTFRTIQARVENELTEQRMEDFFQRDTRRRNAFLSKHACPLVLIVPLGLCLGLFGIAYFIASLVFSVQATVQGSKTYNSAECEHVVGEWLLVYGCLGIFSFVMSCCGRSTYIAENGETKRGGPTPLESLANLAQFAWLVYGVFIMYRREDEFRDCNTKQWDKFEFIVSFLFYGALAMFVVGLLLACMVIPVFFSLLEELSILSSEERPILTEAMLSASSTHGAHANTADVANQDVEASGVKRSVMDF